MSNEIATLEKVKTAVPGLYAEGAKATADAVIVRIGGDSKPTVLKHLRALRDVRDPPTDPMPLTILERAKPFLADIFAAGSAAQEALARAHTERYHRMMSDLETQVSEFEAVVERLERREAELSKDLAASERNLAEATGKLEQRDAEISRLQAELSDCQGDQARLFTDRLEAFEARIADLAVKLEQAEPQKGPGKVAEMRD